MGALRTWVVAAALTDPDVVRFAAWISVRRAGSSGWLASFRWPTGRASGIPMTSNTCFRMGAVQRQQPGSLPAPDQPTGP